MRTLLIVDDEEKVREVLSRFFTTRGFSVTTAGSGAEALKRLDAWAPDYLLLDIHMPDVSGLDVLQQAKQRHPALRVVMVTGRDDTALMDRAFELGAVDYVTKPLNFDEQRWARAFFADAAPTPE